MAKDRDRRYQTPELLVRDLLTVAGSLGLRSINPEGLVWMAPEPAPGWVRHVVWGVPGLAFLTILGFLAWWGDGPVAPTPPPEVVATRPPAPITTPKPTRPVPDRPEPSPEPPREIAVDPRDDLLRVLAEAPPRSTIILGDKGPYDIRGGKSRRLAGLDLTIRAGAGARPVLRLPRDAGGPAAQALLDLAGGRVTLEGLEFLIESGEATSAIRLEDAEVIIRRCGFRRPGISAPGSRPSAIQARSTSRGPLGPLGDRPGASLTVEASEFDGGQAAVVASGRVEVGIRDATFGPAPLELATVGLENPQGGAVPAEIRLSHISVLTGAGPVFRFVGTAPRVRVAESAFAPPSATSPPSTLVVIDAPERLDWRGVDNLYGRVGVYLRPGGMRASTRTFEGWADDPGAIREAGSVATEAPPWEERDPLNAVALGLIEPSRAFRLSLARTSPPRVGARQGPAGPLPGPVLVATTPALTAIVAANPAPAIPTPAETARPRELARASPPAGPPRPKVADPVDEMLEIPLDLVERRADPAIDDAPTAGELVPMPMPMPIDPERPAPVAPPAPIPTRAEVSTPAPVAPTLDPKVIRTAGQFLEALARPGPGPRTLLIAADADWTLPSCRPRGPSGWTIRADRGPTRPRIRFRPESEPEAAPASDPWAAWLTVPPGGLRLEGVDLVLLAGDAPRAPGRRWAAFAVRSGPSDLTLTDCTVTIEGDATRSAVVVVLPEPDRLQAPEPAPATRLRFEDGLFRVGDDLVDVGPGRSVDLDVDNAAIATGGTLVHGHGLPRGRAAGPIRVGLQRVTARLAGGLAQLQSAPGEPELPVADVTARDTILATNDPDAPLFRVDGQGDLDQLRDRIHWEGRSVAYHQIGVYRRDQTARPGALPTRFDRDSWEVAVGRLEESPIHGDLRFLREWDPDRPAWTLQPDDLRLKPNSPATGSGPDFQRLPSAPARVN